jgi:RNA polymerase sigma factor (sigma-70 family)
VGRRDRSDEELLVASVRDARAYGEFYRRYEKPILSFMYRSTGRADLAADLAAETFARALESVESYDPERGPAGGWLFGIGRHVLARSLERAGVERRARERLGMSELLIEDATAERIERMAEGEEGARALELLADLPDEQGEAIRLRVLQEQEYADLSDELSVSEAVVRKRVSRGLAGLRRKLREDDA